MKNKIYKYLQSKTSGASSDELLEKFFHTIGAQPAQMEKILSGLLANDDRFLRDEQGIWHVREGNSAKNLLREVKFCLIDFATMRLTQKVEIPIVLGFVEIQDLKEVKREFFKLDFGQVLGGKIELKHSFEKDFEEIQESFETNADILLKKFNNAVIISRTPQKHCDWLGSLFRHYCGIDYDFQFLSLNDLSLQFSKMSTNKALKDTFADVDGLASKFLAFSDGLGAQSQLFIELIELALNRNIDTLSELQDFIAERETWIDFSKYDFNRDFINSLPEKPGVYFFIDQHEKIFYVGKSKNLKARISSYFINRTEIDSKTKRILENIKKIDYQVLGSELEALVLENQCIRKFSPQINVQIEAHRQIYSNFEKRKIIFLLPGVKESELRLFFIDGLCRAKLVSIDRKDESLDEKCLQLIEQFFSQSSADQSEFDTQQIEIIWRWYELNKENINFVDVENYSSLAVCAQATSSFIRDESLFKEQIFYQES